MEPVKNVKKKEKKALQQKENTLKFHSTGNIQNYCKKTKLIVLSPQHYTF